jgi:hypothetical protein
MAIDFDASIKCKITQTLFETLLENANYRVIPFGVEETVREIKNLDKTTYINLNLPTPLRTMPDFLVTNRDLNKLYLVEVKYRKNFSIETRFELEDKMIRQVKMWGSLFLVIFLGQHEGAAPEMPSNSIRVFKLEIEHDQLVVVKNNDAQKMKFIDVDWVGEYSNKFQNIFTSVSGKYDEQTLSRSLKILKSVN